MTPDLRRMSPETHAAFNAIVLYGARRFQGMPQWDDVLNEEQSNAIHAYLIDLAARAYAAQQAAAGDADAN
jgi:quinohemoprotein ethanol dehydrogenase